MRFKLYFATFIALGLAAPVARPQYDDNEALEFLSRSELEKMLQHPKDDHQLHAIELQLAQCYLKEADHGRDNGLYKKAVELFTLGLKDPQITLISTMKEIVFADALLQNGDVNRGITLLREVISIEPTKIYESALTPSFMEGVSQVHPREELIRNCPEEYAQLVDGRIQRVKAGLLQSLNEYKAIAARGLAEQIYRQDGMEGLRRLSKEYQYNPTVLEVVCAKIAEVTKSTPAEASRGDSNSDGR